MTRHKLTTLLVYILCFCVMAEAIFISILLIQNSKQTNDIDAFKEAAKIQCQRSIAFAPVFEKALKPIMTPKQVDLFNRSVPKRCPK